MNELKTIKNNKGITLIALSITIVVLLILAGASIVMLTGENGLLEKAKTAKEDAENAQIEENATLSEYENAINEYVVESTNRSDIEEQVLWEGALDNTKEQTATLSDSIENYKYILIGISYFSDGGINETLLRVDDITNKGHIFTTYTNNHIWCLFESDTVIKITGGSGNAYLRNVIGIK